MIVEVLNTDEIGKYIPNVNVKTIHLESANNADYMDVFFYIQDQITENFSFRWYDENSLFDKIKIKTLAIFDKNIFNDLLKDIKKIQDKEYLDGIAKQYTLEFLLETPEIQYGTLTDSEKEKINSLKATRNFSLTEDEIKKNLGDSLYKKIGKLIDEAQVKRKDLIKTSDISLKEIIKNYEDIRDIKPEVNSLGERKYYFFKNVKIDISEQQNVFLICFSYIADENKDIKIFGKINNEIVLQSNKPIAKTFLYKDELESYSKVNTDPQVYIKQEFENYKIKDLRIFGKQPEIMKVDLKKDKYKKAKLYLSRSVLNEAAGILNLNIDDILFDISEVYKYFSKNQEVSKIIREYTKIKNLTISRTRIENSAINSDVYKFSSCKDNTKNRLLNPVDNEEFSIKEIRRPSVESDRNFHRYFTFKDKSSKNLKKGKYYYSVDVSLVDGTRKFIYTDILQGIINNKEILGAYSRDCQENSLLVFGSSFFKDELQKIFEDKYKEKLATSIDSLVSTCLIFYKDISEQEMRIIFSSALHPLTSNLELVERVYKFNLDLETLVNNILTNIEKIDPYNIDLKQENVYNNTSELQVNVQFKEVIFDASISGDIGLEYINYSPQDVRKRSEINNFGVPIYNKKFIDTRINREIRRYFANEGANISFNTYNTNDLYAKYLINQNIEATKLSYFSPAYIDFLVDSYDFISLKISNDNFAYQEAELRSINKTHASKDKFFNAFYFLNDSGVLLNQINGKQRIVSGAPDTKNPSILEDYSRATNVSSKTQLSKMNFTSFASYLSLTDSSLSSFFEFFDQKSDSYFLKKLVNNQNRYSDTNIRDIVKKLPIQLKSALFKNAPQVADQITIDLQKQKNNVSFYSKLKIDYNLIKKIEYLEKYSENKEVWSILDDVSFNKLKQNPSNLNIICRLSNYANEITGEKVFEEFSIPTFNEYFLIDLENSDIISLTDDKMKNFRDYNIRIQEINTLDPLEDKIYVDNLKKMMEIF